MSSCFRYFGPARHAMSQAFATGQPAFSELHSRLHCGIHLILDPAFFCPSYGHFSSSLNVLGRADRDQSEVVARKEQPEPPFGHTFDGFARFGVTGYGIGRYPECLQIERKRDFAA